MNLIELLGTLEARLMSGTLDVDVTGLTSDSRKIKEGYAFVCIKGALSDGHDYIDKAVAAGAAVVVMEDLGRQLPQGVTVIHVEDTRYAYALMSAKWFENPAGKLFTIGITGTKGKTTTTYMVRNVLEKCGIKTGLIGTIETIIGDRTIPSCNTTPESYVIHETFDRMVREGCKAVVMEVSSQGLMMHRTAGITFDIGVFTNLEPDHIGPNEHTCFEHYLECKAMLFKQCRVGIVNGDDAHVNEVIKGAACQIEKYGIDKHNDIVASDVQLFADDGRIGIKYKTNGLVHMDVNLMMPGKFSLYNSLCAIAVTRHFNVARDLLSQVFSDIRVKGRIEVIDIQRPFTLMIDYAHNAMALESLLTTLKEYNPGRIVCMFGCGGNRAVSRRYEMGEVSGRLADLTVITSDNPRDEEPEAIMNDIVTGIAKTQGEYVKIADRKEAIRYCISNGRPGDIVVLAGKGHEDYQEIKGVKYPMDERVLIAEVLEELDG